MSLNDAIKRMRRSLNLHESEINETAFSLERLSSLPSFNQRIKFCQQTLPRISSGSSRIVYSLDNGHVLKLARNPKGLEQNRAESDGFVQNHYGSIISQVTQEGPDDIWIVVEKARKVSINDFPKLIGLPFKTVQAFAFYLVDRNDGAFRDTHFSEEQLEQLLENPFLYELESLVGNMDLNAADFGKTSSFGVVNRGGKEVLVLIDYGITENTYQSMYTEEEKTLNEQMLRIQKLAGVSEAIVSAHMVDRSFDRLHSKFSTFYQESDSVKQTVANNINVLKSINLPSEYHIGVLIHRGDKEYNYKKQAGEKLEYSKGSNIWVVVRGNKMVTIIFCPPGVKPTNTEFGISLEKLVNYTNQTGNKNLTDQDMQNIMNPAIAA